MLSRPANFADALGIAPPRPGLEQRVRARRQGCGGARVTARRLSDHPPTATALDSSASVQAGRALLVKKPLNLALGILAAIGGFVDIGDLVFNTAAGATFGYQLMWVIPIGVVGIIVYSEMSGRVAAVSGKAVFDAVRERTGFTAGLARADRVGGREPPHAGGRDRWGRDRAAAAVRTAVPGAARAGCRRACADSLDGAARVGGARSSGTAVSACSSSPSPRSRPVPTGRRSERASSRTWPRTTRGSISTSPSGCSVPR